MWVFGYGSLIWKVDFPFEEKLVGYIKGYVRRFWQGSTDHRGIPGKPGRVVTLVPAETPDECVWGVAYRISPDEIENVSRHLDHREKCGYTTAEVTFHPEDNKHTPFQLLIYIAAEDNPDFLGPADTHQIAAQIYSSKGPSGRNMDYLFELDKAVKEIMPHVEDHHLVELTKAVKHLSSKNREL